MKDLLPWLEVGLLLHSGSRHQRTRLRVFDLRFDDGGPSPNVYHYDPKPPCSISHHNVRRGRHRLTTPPRPQYGRRRALILC